MRNSISTGTLLLLFVTALANSAWAERATTATRARSYNNATGVVTNLGDPFVFKHSGKYYLYGTTDFGNVDGIVVYRSDDLIHWGVPVGVRDGFALQKGDVWGSKWFWSPEVFFANDRFYMIYTVDEHLAVATSPSPLGPFTQPRFGPMNFDIKEIGHKTLREGGKTYIYFSRLQKGNVIVGAEMNKDFLSYDHNTLRRLIAAEEPWEHTSSNPDPNWPIAEAPLVWKHKGWYYLFYTANHFLSPDYAVGYATSKHPLGPFTKYKGNPVLRQSEKIKGTGTTSLVEAPNGQLYMFYHAHCDEHTTLPRKTLMDRVEFLPQKDGSPDVVKVHGPTVEPQQVNW